MPVWFRKAYFGYHARVRLRLKLSCGLGKPWTRDGGIPQGCPHSMAYIVALYLPWCRALEFIPGVHPHLYADNLKCVSGSSAALLLVLLGLPIFFRLVGQDAVPKKCVLLSTFKKTWGDMKDWPVSDAGDKWSVKLDVRDLGGHLELLIVGFRWFFLEFRLLLLSLWISLVSVGSLGLCIFWTLCMVWRLLLFL